MRVDTSVTQRRWFSRRSVQPPWRLPVPLDDAVPLGRHQHLALVGRVSCARRALDGGGRLLLRTVVSTAVSMDGILDL